MFWWYSEGDILYRTIIKNSTSFFKELFSVKPQTTYPLKVLCIINITRYKLKIVLSSDTTFVKCAYDLMVKDLEVQSDGKSSAKSIKNILKHSDLRRFG